MPYLVLEKFHGKQHVSIEMNDAYIKRTTRSKYGNYQWIEISDEDAKLPIDAVVAKYKVAK